MTGFDLLQLLPPATAGRIETLAQAPLATIGPRLDDGTATVKTLTAVLSALTGMPSSEVVRSHPTVLALRAATERAVGHAAATVLEHDADSDDEDPPQADAEPAQPTGGPGPAGGVWHADEMRAPAEVD